MWNIITHLCLNSHPFPSRKKIIRWSNRLPALAEHGIMPAVSNNSEMCICVIYKLFYSEKWHFLEFSINPLVLRVQKIKVKKCKQKAVSITKQLIWQIIYILGSYCADYSVRCLINIYPWLILSGQQIFRDFQFLSVSPINPFHSDCKTIFSWIFQNYVLYFSIFKT